MEFKLSSIYCAKKNVLDLYQTYACLTYKHKQMNVYLTHAPIKLSLNSLNFELNLY